MRSSLASRLHGFRPKAQHDRPLLCGLSQLIDPASSSLAWDSSESDA